MSQHATSTRPTSTEPVTVGWRNWNLLTVAGLTAYATGISWQAQFVSYPLYRAMSAGDFGAYHLAYNDAIPWVVIVPGFASFLACAAMPFTRPQGVSRTTAWVAAVAGAGSLLSTVLWAIPMHDRLDAIGQDPATIDSLIQANGVRTAFITIAAGALGWGLAQVIGSVRGQAPVAHPAG
jgi:hypothetical protein